MLKFGAYLSTAISELKQASDLFILDTLFPKKCLLCNRPDTFLCQPCQNKIVFLKEQLCPFCERIVSPEGKACYSCRGKKDLDFLIQASEYKKDGMGKLIHHFKYRFLEELGESLGELLAEALLKNNSPLPDVIVPIPLHPKRLRFRGFNQAEILASKIGQNLTPGMKIPVETSILFRKRYTSPQMKIKTFQERHRNLQDVFGVKKTETFQGKKILLVDDVATTGTTLFECARTLKKNGAREVGAAVLARQKI